MASSVSYINNKENIKETTAVKAVNRSLGFDLKDIKSASLGNGGKPQSGINKSYNYGTSGKIASEVIPYTGPKTGDDSNPSLTYIVSKMNDTLFIPKADTTFESNFNDTVEKYNRFKVANPNLMLQRGFAHVFFVRPNCNIMTSNDLRDELKSNETFHYTWKKSPNVVRELVKGNNHDFMMSLSNAVSSFSVNEEYINSDTYGKTYTGYSITYGKHNIQSKTSGDLTVEFNDDRNMHIYQLHRLWVEYISGVYRGQISPDNESIIKKILDYVGACYYIVTAEDGETILFWTKYYGLFPTNIPTNQYSWGSGNVIQSPTVSINYRYSFKEDFNPYTILEFNYNSRVGTNGTTYLPIYDPKLNHVGATWVGAPFIELIRDPSSGVYEYKLRFRPS